MENKKLVILTSITAFLVLVAILVLNVNVATDYAKDINIKEYNIGFDQAKDNSGELIAEETYYEFGDAILEYDTLEESISNDSVYENDVKPLDELKESNTKSSTNNKTVENKNTTSSTSKSNTSTQTTKTTTAKPVTSSMPYYIKVNRTQNVVNIYTKDADGNYTVPFKAMLCSIGTSTPKAGTKYKITTYRRTWNALKGNVYGQYAVQIVGNILFHSVPYTAKNNSSLEYWEYDKLGTKASMGCIRLTVQDAKWIYDNIGAGTYVEFYEDDNPGPLGKPSAKKISDNEFCRNWDPTDYIEGNPWHTNNDVEIAPTYEVTTNTTEETITSNNNSQETINSEIEQINSIFNNQIEISGEIYFLDPEDAKMLQEQITQIYDIPNIEENMPLNSGD
ncbi:MAG: L,D-transpeptidase [Clostridia bacterium]|nr:L,D-transpeptidase [Clostridia bacterium]